MEQITIADAFRMKDRDPTIKSLEFGSKVELWDATGFDSEPFSAPNLSTPIVTFKHEDHNLGKKWTTTYEIKQYTSYAG